VHREGVANPERAPSGRAVRDLDGLRVHRHHVRGRLADAAARDVALDLALGDRHHRDGGAGGEPVGLVVARRVVAHVVEVAEQERHRREARQAGASVA